MNNAPSPFHSYIFFDAEPSIRTLTKAKLEQEKKVLAKSVESLAKKHAIVFHAYGTLGFKAGTRLMLHLNSATPEAFQLFLKDILHTPVGAHLKIAYTLFGMTRPSPYRPKHLQEKEEKTPKDPEPAAADQPHKYLVVYPFTKTIDWHLSPLEFRRDVMKAHVEVGRKWSKTVSQLLLYAYGVDDHEFIVSYYTDRLADFQSLVMEMRATESRRYTKNDLPIFTCIHLPLSEALDLL